MSELPASGVASTASMQPKDHVAPLIERDRLQSIIQRLIEIGTSVHQLAILLAGLSTTPAVSHPPAGASTVYPAGSTMVDLFASAAAQAQSVAEIIPRSDTSVEAGNDLEIEKQDAHNRASCAGPPESTHALDGNATNEQDVSGYDSLAVEEPTSVQDESDAGAIRPTSDAAAHDATTKDVTVPKSIAIALPGTVDATDSVISSEHAKPQDAGSNGAVEHFNDDQKDEQPITKNEMGYEEKSTSEEGGDDTLRSLTGAKDLREEKRSDGVVDVEAAMDASSGEQDMESCVSKESHPTEGLNGQIEVKLPQSATQWQPLPVQNFAALDAAETDKVPDKANTQTFSLDLLQRTLGGEEWSSGFYWVRGQLAFGVGGYYVINPIVDPCSPTEPGRHGAKLVPFYNQTQDHNSPAQEIFQDAPLFVAVPGDADAEREYVYYGHYSQSRLTDLLSYDHQAQHVAYSVKEYWANQLASPDRPSWVTDAIKDHFFMQPAYGGDLGRIVSKGGRVDIPEDFKEYVLMLKDWDDDCKEQLSRMTAKNFLDAFEAAEHEDPPGLRLQIEYLECLRFDRSLYDALVEIKRHDLPKVHTGPRFSNAPAGWNIVGLSMDNFPALPGPKDGNDEGTGRDRAAHNVPRWGYVPPHRRTKPNGTATSTEDMSKDGSA